MVERKKPGMEHEVETVPLETATTNERREEHVPRTEKGKPHPPVTDEPKAIAAARDTALKLTRPRNVEPTKESIETYVHKYLPEYLRSYSAVAKAASSLLDFGTRVKETLGMEEVIGRENIPEEGSFLVVSNHAGGETPRLLALFGKKPFHISAGEELNFNRSPFRNWLLKKLQMIPVKESLAHLSEEEKTNMMQRLPERSKAGYERILQKEKDSSVPFNKEYVRTTVAALMKGDRVAVFPEGLFTYGEKGLREGYPGFLLIAREYKRQTGQELRIVPVGCSKSRTEVGEPMSIGETTDVSDVMSRIAALLPEADRGFYAAK